MVAQEILDLLVWVRALVPEPFFYLKTKSELWKDEESFFHSFFLYGFDEEDDHGRRKNEYCG